MTEPTDGNPLTSFGANEWLVDEMYERYQKDPGSVDPAWGDYFKSRGNGSPPTDTKAATTCCVTWPESWNGTPDAEI